MRSGRAVWRYVTTTTTIMIHTYLDELVMPADLELKLMISRHEIHYAAHGCNCDAGSWTLLRAGGARAVSANNDVGSSSSWVALCDESFAR